METVKPMLASKGIIGAIVAALAALLSVGFGINLSAEQVSGLTDNVYILVIVLSNLVGFIAALVAAYGRKNATAQIGGIVVPDVTKAPDPTAVLRAANRN